MEKLGESLKKLLLIGIGTAAVTAEKSKEVLDDLVKKGELTVEQGKVLNKELKHNIKETLKENVNVSVKASTPEELQTLLEKMTPEQIEQLKQQISNMEQTAEEKDREQWNQKKHRLKLQRTLRLRKRQLTLNKKNEYKV
ncbi:MAG: phasin family protein [Coprococcus sp.]